MCLQPPHAVYIFYPLSQAVQGHPKTRLPCHHPSEWKSSHEGRLRVPVTSLFQHLSHLLQPKFLIKPLILRVLWWIQSPAQWGWGSECWEIEHRRFVPSTELPLSSLPATQKGLVENYSLGTSTYKTSRFQQTEQPKQQGKSVTASQRIKTVGIISLFFMSCISSLCYPWVLTLCKDKAGERRDLVTVLQPRDPVGRQLQTSWKTKCLRVYF